MPIWTNVHKLPKPIEILITKDLYNQRRQEQLERYCLLHGLDISKIVHFSASDLIKPPRMRVLTKRYSAKIVKDVASDIFRILGQAIHHFLREAAILGELDKEGYKAEERLFAHFQVEGRTVVISGEPDIVSPEGKIQDYKVVAVYSYLKGIKQEYEQQTNIYAFLRAVQGLVNQGLEICYILRDWNVNETVQEGYPSAGSQVSDARLWPFEEQKAWILDRIKLHLANEHEWDDGLEECTAEEMWEKPDSYAVIREGGKRAVKVFTAEHAKPLAEETQSQAALREAAEDERERNGRLKKNEKPYVVEHRPGERTRCLRFCDASQVCNIFREYAAASFRGTGKEAQPVEEA